jgi:hypothetical protein
MQNYSFTLADGAYIPEKKDFRCRIGQAAYSTVDSDVYTSRLSTGNPGKSASAAVR